MRLRAKLDKRLKKIENRLIKMGSLVEKSIDYSFEALKNDNDELAIKVLELDKSIDQLEITIEQECINLIALQQPIASDLREVAGIIRIIVDLERIGDLAENIAKIQLTNDEVSIESFETLFEMQEVVQDMLRGSLNAFVERDSITSREIAKRDVELDGLYEVLYSQVLDSLIREDDKKEAYIPILFIGRYLERMGDHVTNICERIVYMQEGVREYY